MNGDGPDKNPPLDTAAILEAHARGELSTADATMALEQLRTRDAIEDLGFARVDHDRARRRGFPEVIFGQGKAPGQIAEIFASLADRNPNVLATRTTADAATATRERLGGVEIDHDETSGVMRLWRDREVRGRGAVAVVAAGTSDQRVAREARLCAETMGNEVRSFDDVGVAGLHRLLAVVEDLRACEVVVTVAGMEAALPSVVAGLLARPVVSVPTSVGYGASFGGVTALLSSLNACAPGVLTVNIDNGFGAAYASTLINGANRTKR